MIHTILLVFAFVLTLIAAFVSEPYTVPPGWRFPHLGWLGVSLYFLALILGGATLR